MQAYRSCSATCLFAAALLLLAGPGIWAGGQEDGPAADSGAAPAAAAEMAASVELPRAGQAHYNLSDYEALTGRTLTFKEAPLLAARVQAGELPPVDQRLPDEPVVVIPFAELGKYGGSLTIPSMSAASWWPASQATPEYPMTRDMRWPDTLLPGMAEAWGMSEDGKTFTLTFRKGLKWSDGEPFSADDVLFWWEDYILDEEVTPTIPKYWEPQGHEMEVSKVDDMTVQFQFAVPYTTVQFYFSQWANKGMQSHSFLPRHALTRFHIKYNEDANQLAKDEGFDSWSQLFQNRARYSRDSPTFPEIPYLGPWILKNVRMDGVSWERNPYYFKVDPEGNQLPYIDELRSIWVTDVETLKIRALAGDFDYVPWGMSTSDVPVLTESAEQSDFRIIMPPGVYAAECGIFINQTYDLQDPAIAEVLRNRNFKQALSLAMNRAEINEVVAFGLADPVQATTYPKNSFYQERWAQSYVEYDPERANQLLDEMGMDQRDGDGFRLLPNGEPFTLVAEFPVQVAVLTKTGELLKEYWDNVGIRTLVKSPQWSAMSQRIGTGEFMIITWPIDGVDALSSRIDPNPIDPLRPGWTMPLWWSWWRTEGEEGLEPPAEIQELFALAERKPFVDDEEFTRDIANVMMDFQAEDLSPLGTIAYMRYPTVVKNKLGNVDALTVYGFSHASDGTKSHRPEVMFWKE